MSTLSFFEEDDDDVREPLGKIIQSYIYVKKELFWVSTMCREGHSGYSMKYNETIIFELDPKTKDVKKMIACIKDNHLIDRHFGMCRTFLEKRYKAEEATK